MTHLHKKIKKGRPYYYIREIQRVNGKPKVTSQIYLGSADNIAKVYQQDKDDRRPVKLQTESFGALYLTHELEKEIDTIGIINSVVQPTKKSQSLSVGDYFFFAWANRLINPKSKRALESWYKKTAIQQIKPFDISKLNSMQYWKQWDKVSEDHLKLIGQKFFEKIWSTQKLPPDCILFDTTNTYTYMDSKTPSDLCKRGKNKDSKHHLRQLGLGLLVDRETEIPLFYKVYPGNNHDSKFFHQTIDEMFGVMCKFNQTKQNLTVVFDKGMNSDENIEYFDSHNRIHFITTYSPYFVEEIASVDLKHFIMLDLEKNKELIELDQSQECQLAYRTKIDLWGKERSLVVTYSPKLFRKKLFKLDEKLESLRESLLEFRSKYKEQLPHWRDAEGLQTRYERLCEQMHIGSQYYNLEFKNEAGKFDLSFRKDTNEYTKATKLFGRNVIVTDNIDWTTEEIVQKSLDRGYIERSFRSAKDLHHVSIRPFFHWTDSKIRCQMLTCVIALTMSRLLEQRIKNANIVTDDKSSSAKSIMEEMSALNSVVCYYPNSNKAERIIEDPNRLQSEVLRLFGVQVGARGVLQKLLP